MTEKKTIEELDYELEESYDGSETGKGCLIAIAGSAVCWIGVIGLVRAATQAVHAFVEGYTNGFYPMQNAIETAAAFVGDVTYKLIHR